MTVDPYLTPDEMAKLLKVTPQHVRRMIKKGALNAIRFGIGQKAPLRIPSTELERIAVMGFEETMKNVKG